MENTIDEHITNGLVKISQALKSGDWENFAKKGITPTQKQVMVFLNKRKKSIPASLTDIAENLAFSPATASDVVQKLVDKGLVQKESAPDDKRKIMIRLTKKGQSLSGQVMDWSNFLTSAVGGLSDKEKSIFLGGLIKIIKSLQDQGKIPFVRMCLTCNYFRPNQHKNTKRPHHCAFVDEPLAHEQLRLDCDDHEQLEKSGSIDVWNKFQQMTK